MKSQEEVDSIKEGLSATIKNMNGLRRNHATIDADVLEAFRTLVQDIRNFNSYNNEEIIPITVEVDEILAGGSLFKLHIPLTIT